MEIKTVLMVLMSGIVQRNLEKDVQLVIMVNLYVKMVIAYHLEIDVMVKKIVLMAVMKTEPCVHQWLVHLENIDVTIIIVYLIQMSVMVQIIVVMVLMKLNWLVSSYSQMTNLWKQYTNKKYKNTYFLCSRFICVLCTIMCSPDFQNGRTGASFANQYFQQPNVIPSGLHNSVHFISPLC